MLVFRAFDFVVKQTDLKLNRLVGKRNMAAFQALEIVPRIASSKRYVGEEMTKNKNVCFPQRVLNRKPERRI
jgi:hypothetical protein